MVRPIADLENAISYRFKDRSLLNEALTHPSFVNESGGKVTNDNQRLEFLGDAVIGLLLSQEIFLRYPQSREGELTRIRSSLVDEASLALLAGMIDLGSYLLLGRGEEKTGGRDKPSLLADAYEALMAAVYLDGGLEAVAVLIRTHFSVLLERPGPQASASDYKTQFQELAHLLTSLAPRYLLQGLSGPDHQRIFSVVVFVGDDLMGHGSGRSKKEAEQAAAREGILVLSTPQSIMIATVPFFISHQGCPHQCVFCNQTKIAGISESIPDEAEIEAKVAAYRLTAGGGPIQVAFFGGTFTALPRPVQLKLLQPLQPLIATGEVVSVRVSTRPDCIDLDTARFLHSMGVGIVELGIQSMADDVLCCSGRGHTAADVEQAASILQEAGLLMGAQLMPGLPGDTPGTALESLERVIKLRPHCLRIYPTLVISGTPLAELYAQGRYEPLTMDNAIRLCAAMLHRAWNADLPVIRMGLQPTTELEAAGTILAGPYHPAFRYLVEAELCLQLLGMLIKDIKEFSKVTIYCAPSRISTVTGHKRANVQLIEQIYGVTVQKVRSNPDLSSFEIIVEANGEVFRGNLLHELDSQQYLAEAKEEKRRSV